MVLVLLPLKGLSVVVRSVSILVLLSSVLLLGSVSLSSVDSISLEVVSVVTVAETGVLSLLSNSCDELSVLLSVEDDNEDEIKVTELIFTSIPEVGVDLVVVGTDVVVVVVVVVIDDVVVGVVDDVVVVVVVSGLVVTSTVVSSSVVV